MTRPQPHKDLEGTCGRSARAAGKVLEAEEPGWCCSQRCFRETHRQGPCKQGRRLGFYSKRVEGCRQEKDPSYISESSKLALGEK